MSKKKVLYYTDRKGRSPVLEDIGDLLLKEQEKIFAYVTLLQERGEELRRPISDYVGDKLYELRPKAFRVLYFFMLKEYAVVLHLFRKKTSQLPHAEISIALARMKDFIDRFQLGEIN